MTNNLKKYHQAAFSYVGLGVVIVLLTAFFVPSNHYRSGFGPLLGGIVVLLILSYFLYIGVTWLAKVLSVLALGRTLWWVYSFFAFGDETSRWVYILSAVLNGIIFFMLLRGFWNFSASTDNSNGIEKAPIT